MRLREFFRRWGEGIKNLSPRRQLESKIVGLWGTIAGIVLGGTILTIQGNWYFILLFGFMIFMQLIELISTYQQLRQIKSFEEGIE